MILKSEVDRVIKFLKSKPGYLKTGEKRLAYTLKCSTSTLKMAKKALKEENKHDVVEELFPYNVRLIRNEKPILHSSSFINKFDPKNVLVIGDTHEPFCKEGYLEHCLQVQKDYNCGTVVHIGDLVDFHAISYHESDVDGRSPGDEYKLALAACDRWYKSFPNAYVCIGNHDRLPFRKAFTAGLPKNWLKSYQEMFNSPKGWKWDFVHEINGVIYQHGTGLSGEMASINAARENRQSTVIGHLHTVSNTRFLASQKDLIFGMNVGCGIDHTKYAFAYGRENTRKPVLSCGVVLGGKMPINVPMRLGKQNNQ